MEQRALREYLERRLGQALAHRRMEIEREHEAQVFGQGLNWFHPENLSLSRKLIKTVLVCTGLYGRGRQNARAVRITHNSVASARLPAPFDGFTLLHLSDLHLDMSQDITQRILTLVESCTYDICVLTGDYRARTSGSYKAAVADMKRLRQVLRGPVFAVLGNHDSIAMLPAIEDLGIRVLMNESERIKRDETSIVIAGVDDAHFFRADDVGMAASGRGRSEYSILLSHTPEIYRSAAQEDFDLMLSGHTHGGQICLPGGVPLTLDSALPRRFGAGAWQHGRMAGYTSRGAGCSIIPVRFNCPPEITLHTLRAACSPSIGAVADAGFEENL
jgi:predicted MPP superfamily phosphohydrolase